ncbi:nucleotide disphospho-sugar-binding domain-containing protein [Rhodococcus sp. TAF43]|uniref:glycosyltransferase n=1 Tax=unclassified Rhodococcus (in: high G+C Gram-positive bacteria) TaxID=192944 RepID=UPI001583BD1F|nr:nucleotide disphospho-sugar-binding domain-containing protein [Rhodococcus sp. W8901]QKT11232.1 glycosyl transferase [Rhodococcus sp. W8901]
MRVAVVAGPEAGHAVPALALCRKFVAAGDDPVFFSAGRWLDVARGIGIEARKLGGLAPREFDDDSDSGSKIHGRAAHVSTALLPDMRDVAPDLVVSDIITVGGGMAAERLGVPWVELSPHPLYLPSKGLPPIGSGMAPGTGVGGRLRDTLLRAATAPSIRKGRVQRSEARVSVGLSARDPGPAARLIATLPALEVPRPDWPSNAHVVGPLVWEPADNVLDPPPGDGPLVVLAPSTASTGAGGMLDTAIRALDGLGVRMLVTLFEKPEIDLPDWVRAGYGRQDEMLRNASALICGAGHGVLAKGLLAGVPAVTVPGGGDQWEVANRVARGGLGVMIRPLEVATLRDAVRKVLDDPAYAAAARRAADGIADVADPVAVCRAAA